MACSQPASLTWPPAPAFSTRDVHELVLLAGFVVNEALARALKHVLKDPRPPAFCQRLDVCDEFGLPSAHTQCIAFGLALHALLCARKFDAKSAGTRLTQLVEVAGLAAATALTAASRVYLGYHTVPQVAAGAVLGLAMGTLWFGLASALQPSYGWAARQAWGRLLHLKDTWGAADALQVEAKQAAASVGGQGGAKSRQE